jgi:hypothetical protein
MIVSIMQPAYLPWLGYFERLLMSDLHIVLDHVPIDLNSKTKFANRNKIRTVDGSCWLTIPLRTKGQRDALGIDQLKMANDEGWSRRHWRSIEMNYRRAPHFADYAPAFENVLASPEPELASFLCRTTKLLLEFFAIEVPILRSSQMGIASHKQQLILDLCRAAGATCYISGPFGRDYLDEETFRSAGIELKFHDYQHPEYRQTFPGFVPHLSALDLLLNHGREGRDILQTNKTLRH